jgi:hypothetical protein
VHLIDEVRPLPGTSRLKLTPLCRKPPSIYSSTPSTGVKTVPDQIKLTETYMRWMFSLPIRIGDFVSSDDMNLLRNSVRACTYIFSVLVHNAYLLADRRSTKGYVLPRRVRHPYLNECVGWPSRLQSGFGRSGTFGTTWRQYFVELPSPDPVTFVEPSVMPT